MSAKFNYYDNTDNNNKTIFELEKEIAREIDSFNREYLKYAKCTTITEIKSGNSAYFGSTPSKANIYNDLSVNTLTCSTMPTTKNAACKISDISNARQILPTNQGTGTNYSKLTSSGNNASNRVDWTIYSVNNGSEVSGNYTFEVSGNDVYVYKSSGTDINSITYKIIEDYDCTNANNDTGIATLASNIGTKVTSINTILTNIQTNGATDKVNDQQFTTNLANIKTKHQDILNLRNDLDMKMREMRNMGDGGYRVDQKIKMDATLYSSLAWTILATSLLYYVFVKMD